MPLQLGFSGVASPVRALEAVAAVSTSPLWDSGAADYLLGVPIAEGLRKMRMLLAGNAACVQLNKDATDMLEQEGPFHTLPFIWSESRDRERGGLLMRDIYNLFKTVLLNLLSVRLARKVYSCSAEKGSVNRITRFDSMPMINAVHPSRGCWHEVCAKTSFDMIL